jgi:HK97 family phage major capsid protein
MATVSITRENASALITPEESNEIIQAVVESSTALQVMTRLPNMGTGVREYPIMDSYPMAGFVDGDTGLKMTTNMTWSKDKLTAGEIAAIVAVPDSVANDADYDIFAQLKPRLVEAAGRVIDSAIFFGTNKPSAWRDGIVTSAVTAGNNVSATSDIYTDVFGESGLIAKVEEDGYFPESIVSAISMRAKLRGLKDTTGRPLFLENMQQGAQYTLNGMGMSFPRNGAWDASKALMLTGDWKQAVYAIRQDVTFDVFDSGVVSDSDGKVVYNLMQNDMKAIRMVIRLGWNVLNPVNAVNEDGSTRFPFAVYQPVGG